MWQLISTVGRDLIHASIFMVGRPGLDSGTLGLKVQFKRLQPDASCYRRSQWLVQRETARAVATG